MKKLSKSDLQLTRAEEEARRIEDALKTRAVSWHFKPGSGVTYRNESYAVIAVDGERMLIANARWSGWVKPFALASNGAGVGNEYAASYTSQA